MDFLHAILGLFFGGIWASYGYFLVNDGFIYVPHTLWLLQSLVAMGLYGYNAYHTGGLDLGFETSSDNDDDDFTVDRLNRASTIGSRRSMDIHSMSRDSMTQQDMYPSIPEEAHKVV
jgi:hypothetical protein